MRLLLIDLSSLYWPRWHSATKANRSPDTAAQWTAEHIARIATGYDRVIICCDEGRSFRYGLHEGYKAKRSAKDPVAVEHLQALRVTLAESYTVAAAEGFEGEDIIATIEATAAERGWLTDIVSADKDVLQLVAPRTRVLDGGEPVDVVARMGVPASQVAAYLSLAGDASDGVPGCEGVGEKTAVALLAAYDSLSAIVAALACDDPLAGCKPRVGALLREHWASVVLSSALVRLRTDAPIGDVFALHVHTARLVSGGDDAPDVFDVSAGMLAPSYELATRSQEAMRLAYEAGDEDAIEAARDAYRAAYVVEMRASYKAHRGEWARLLARRRVVLACGCSAEWACHRGFLREDILPKLGAVDCGSLD